MRWASQEILENAKVFKTLDEALRGSTMALALSGRDDKVALLDVREGVRQLGTAPAEATTCLVFGPELLANAGEVDVESAARALAIGVEDAVDERLPGDRRTDALREGRDRTPRVRLESRSTRSRRA